MSWRALAGLAALTERQAHHNPTVQALWGRFEQVCTWVKLNELAESQELFSHFEPVDL